MGKVLVTFGGNFCHFPLMQYDLVYVDRTYVECEDRLGHTDVKWIETGEQDRRRRIARVLIEVLRDARDTITIVDSDVYLPRTIHGNIPIAYCIPARAKPSNDVHMFCTSTNMTVPRTYVDRIRQVLEDYLEGRYVSPYVDINIYQYIVSFPVALPGTRHYIQDKCYEVVDNKTFRSCDTT